MLILEQGKHTSRRPKEEKRTKVIYKACALLIQTLPQAFSCTHGAVLPKFKVLRVLKGFPLILFCPSASCGVWPCLRDDYHFQL